MNIRDYVNKRCLLKVTKGYSSDVQEFKIIEVSPSGNWVKLQSNYSGQKFWKQISDIAFVELLQEFESRPTSRAADGCTCPLIDDNTMGINPLCVVHGELANR